MCDQLRLRPACAYAQSDQSLYYSLEHSMTVNLLIEDHLVFISLKRGRTGSSDHTLVKMPHCWKPDVATPRFGVSDRVRLNQPAQLQRLTRILKSHMKQVWMQITNIFRSGSPLFAYIFIY